MLLAKLEYTVFLFLSAVMTVVGLRRQRTSAFRAVERFPFGRRPPFACVLPPHLVVDELCTDDARGYSHDGVAHEHDHGTEEAAYGRDGSYVAISHRGHGDDGPVDAGGDVRELRVGPAPLHHIHHRAERDGHDDHEEEEHQDFVGTEAQRLQQFVAFGQETEQFEDAEYADEAEGAQYHQVACRGEYPPQVEGQRAEQVDDAEEAQGILPGGWRAVQPAQVFQCEEEGEDVFQYGEGAFPCPCDAGHTLCYDQCYAGHDGPEQHHVEGLPQRGVAFEDDDVEFLFQRVSFSHIPRFSESSFPNPAFHSPYEQGT